MFNRRLVLKLFGKRLKKAARSPGLAAVNVLFGVVAGLVATVFHAELANSVPLIWLRDGIDLNYGDWSWTAFWFWTLLIVFAVIWAFRESVGASDRKEEIATLGHLIETVAPPEFLELYEEAYILLANLRSLSSGNYIREELRLILDYVIQLAMMWDYKTGSRDAFYRANVMVALRKTTWNSDQKSAGRSMLGGSGWDAAATLADGGLWVDPSLATANAVGGKEDPDVEPLLLLYSHQHNINLDGAPKAFTEKGMRYVEDSMSIVSNFPSGLSRDAEISARGNYENDLKAKSIISLPIPGISEIAGVLNIYRNTVGIMGSDERATSFARLLAPFTGLLGQILNELDVTH